MNVLLCSSNVLPCPVADQQLMSLAQLVADAVLCHGPIQMDTSIRRPQPEDQ